MKNFLFNYWYSQYIFCRIYIEKYRKSDMKYRSKMGHVQDILRSVWDYSSVFFNS